MMERDPDAKETSMSELGTADSPWATERTCGYWRLGERKSWTHGEGGKGEISS